MSEQTFSMKNILTEVSFTTSRSGGPGGQNVNKVNSKVILHWNIATAASISEDQRALLLQKLKSRITNEGVLQITSQESRSQQENKAAALDKLRELITRSFYKPKARKATRPTKASVKKRIDDKKKHAEKKQSRRKW